MKKYLYFQTAVLIGGAVFAWFNLFGDFGRFFANNGKLLELTGCQYPNPLATPCFYGSIAFLITLTLAFQILLNPSIKIQKYLTCLLLAGTLFAWSMVAKEFNAFSQTKPGNYIGCTGLKALSPIHTPCFTGATLFLISFIISIIIYFSFKKKYPDAS